MKRCTKCGEEKPLDGFYAWARSKDGRMAQCRKCHKANVKAYEKRNPEKRAKWQAIGQANYRNRHPERRRKSIARWRERNRERYDAWRRQYRLANREHIAAYNRAYGTANPEIMARKRRKRRALLAGVESQPYTRRAIYERDGGRCRGCDKELAYEPNGFHIDHIVPIALEGPDVPANVQPLCPPCNYTKRADLEGQIHLPV